MQIGDYVKAQLSAVKDHAYYFTNKGSSTYSGDDSQKLFNYGVIFQKGNYTRQDTSKSNMPVTTVEFTIKTLVKADGKILQSKILNERGVEIPVITDRIVEEYFNNKMPPPYQMLVPNIRRSTTG